MLPGQNFRRNHDRRLPSVFHRQNSRQYCHYCLTRSDITLQQTVHRLSRSHVIDNLIKTLFLTRRQSERQLINNPSKNFPRPVTGILLFFFS